MIKITNQQLRAGLEIARRCSQCKDSVACLWGEQKNLPKEPCLIPPFRKIFESNSPALFGKLKDFSEFQRRTHNFYGLQIEGGTQEQVYESQREFHDLHIFAQAVLLTLYPLYLANHEEIPLLTPEEINEEPLEFSGGQIDSTGAIMQRINQKWLDWIVPTMDNLYSPQKYTKIILWLVRLFLKGVEKTQPPCLLEMSEEEKGKLFEEIEKMLFQKKEGQL